MAHGRRAAHTKRNIPMKKRLGDIPIFHMAFRPFYLLASVFGILSILHWGFSSMGGNEVLPGFFIHAHEMIWGYTGMIISAFLLTAVATWTSQPATKGWALVLLGSCWLLARLAVFASPLTGAGPAVILMAVFNFAFFLLTAYYFGKPIIKTRNKRNYIPIFGLIVLGLTEVVFATSVYKNYQSATTSEFYIDAINTGLYAGIMAVAGFISLIGMRVIPFFTARRLGNQQVANPKWMMRMSMGAPLILAILVVLGSVDPRFTVVFSGFAVFWGLTMLWAVKTWYYKTLWQEPLLWVLHIGFAFSALGVFFMGVSVEWFPAYISASIHLITVGGIGMMTVGMMARTSLGHTGRPLKVGKDLTLAFILMGLATVARVAVAFMDGGAYEAHIRIAAVLFAFSLLLFVWRYAPWMFQERADAKERAKAFKILQ